MENNNFEIRVRAVIEKEGKILVCHHSKDQSKAGYYFLPGGHVEFGESSQDALVRELNEELDISIKGHSFIGAAENIFSQKGKIHHEVNLVFSVSADYVEDKSKEDHIEFLFLSKEEFLKQNVLPYSLRDAVIKWQEDKLPFLLTNKSEE